MSTEARETVRMMLRLIGEDPEREGLQDTPDRVVRAWKELFAGYQMKVADILCRTFPEKYNQMVVVKDIEFYSTCEHHLLPFIGKAHIGYIPDGKVLGLSKIPRLLDVFARRAQVQERIGEQVVDALMEYLKPKGAACVIEARHLCMCCRGVQKQDSSAVTSSLRGEFLTQPEVRAEFFTLAGLR